MADNQAESLAASKPLCLAEQVSDALEDKASLPFTTGAILGVLAGAYVALGGLFATIALAGGEAMPYGASQLLAGTAFALGLVLVIVAGAELFTGNTLMTGLLMVRRLSLRQMLSAWGVVYVANLTGAILIALLVFASEAHLAGNGAVGQAALKLAEAKGAPGFLAAFASGVLANMLVCLAVWISYGAKSTADKIVAIILPISAFVAAGLEHSVANMYLIPYGWMVKSFADASFWQATGLVAGSYPSISATGFAANLVPVTLGNIAGGFLIAAAYTLTYLRKPG